MTLTDADLARLEALDEGATAGPWRVYVGAADLHILAPHEPQPVASLADHGAQLKTHDPDAALIAEFRNRTPDLVAELREARAALARVKALCEQAVAGYQPHDVTPWVAVHELRAAMAGE